MLSVERTNRSDNVILRIMRHLSVGVMALMLCGCVSPNKEVPSEDGGVDVFLNNLEKNSRRNLQEEVDDQETPKK